MSDPQPRIKLLKSLSCPNSMLPYLMIGIIVMFFSQATDADPAGPNSQIQYSIAFADGTTSSPMFTIDASSGGVSATGLDFETSTSHNLIITASDAGTPQQSSTASLQVSVTVGNHFFLC